MHFKNNTKRGNVTIQGLRSFKDTLPKNVKKIINKKGHIYSETLSNWRYIVGDELFKVCYPKSFKNSNRFGVSTLLVMVKRGHEVDLEYSKKIIPASLDLVDIAGLVKGASQGEGLGNAFLSNIREMNALAHVVRCFDDENITHVDGSIDPVRDAEIINLELIMSDLETVSKRLHKCEKLVKTNDKKNKIEHEILLRIKNDLDQGRLINLDSFNDDEKIIIKSFQLLSSKPTFYIANISDDGSSTNALSNLEAFASQTGNTVIPTSIKIEQEIALLEDEERKEYLELMGMDEPVLNKIIFKGYEILGLQTYFTAGPQEIRAWTIKNNASAPNAAGVIHTDFERGFIKAEVISFNDYISCDGELGSKEKGKLRLEGKEYIVKDGDVIHFKFNV